MTARDDVGGGHPMTPAGEWARMLRQRHARCPECGRTFDLLDDTDAGEWFYGHDCEAPATRTGEVPGSGGHP